MKKQFIALAFLFSTFAYADSVHCENKNTEINDQQSKTETVRELREVSSTRDFFPDATSR